MFENIGIEKPIKAWKAGVPFDSKVVLQLLNAASMPFVQPWIAAMPDSHWGMGAPVGAVIPTEGALIPAAVGVDIGCGMMAVKTPLKRETLFDLKLVRESIERAVPHGRTNDGKPGDRGAWFNVPEDIEHIWDDQFRHDFDDLPDGAKSKNALSQLGTLGTGNHFIEIALSSRDQSVWIVLHSGSRGFGNRIGSYYTGVAKKLCDKFFVKLVDSNLAYLPEGTQEFSEYQAAVITAQRYAWTNRQIMVGRILEALGLRWDDIDLASHEVENPVLIHCHHNYVAVERHHGKNLFITRKGAVRAQENDLAIIPGSMGARTYIARGLGNPDSFCSCSHGAGRTMGRKEAQRTISIADHESALVGVECHRGPETLDETPAAYKNIDAVMEAQKDLVEPLFYLSQFVNVKGWEK